MEKINSKIVNISIEKIKPYKGAHKVDGALEDIKASIQEFGITQPLSVDKDYVIAKGNGVYRAALELGIKELPCIVLDYLSEEEIKEYRIADNKTSEFASWNEEKLKKELSYLKSPLDMQRYFDEDINKMLGTKSIEKPKTIDQTQAKEEKTEAKFQEDIKKIEKQEVVKSVDYFEYICSNCGKKITTRR